MNRKVRVYDAKWLSCSVIVKIQDNKRMKREYPDSTGDQFLIPNSSYKFSILIYLRIL